MTEETKKRIMDMAVEEMLRKERPARIEGAKLAVDALAHWLKAWRSSLPKVQAPDEPFSEREMAITTAVVGFTLERVLAAIEEQKGLFDKLM